MELTIGVLELVLAVGSVFTAVVIWAVRLEAKANALKIRVKSGEQTLADTSSARTAEVNSVKEDVGRQGDHISQDRAKIGDIQQKLVGLDRDIKTACAKANRAQQQLDGHMKKQDETIDRVWNGIEELKLALARMGVRGDD